MQRMRVVITRSVAPISASFVVCHLVVCLAAIIVVETLIYAVGGNLL